MSHEVVYALANKVDKVLREKDVYCEVEPEFREDFPAVRLLIHWGDWKHDHLRAKWVCQELLGGVLTGSIVTEEDGSDAYSAEHVFVFPAWKKEAVS